MNTPSASDPVCKVIGADKLPAQTGGASALCGAIEKALAETKVTGPISIEITIRSPRVLAAAVKRGDVALPEMTMDVFDTAINQDIIDRFARSVANYARSGA